MEKWLTRKGHSLENAGSNPAAATVNSGKFSNLLSFSQIHLYPLSVRENREDIWVGSMLAYVPWLFVKIRF